MKSGFRNINFYNFRVVWDILLTASVISLAYAIVEYLLVRNTQIPKAFIPLLIRSQAAAFMIGLSFSFFEILTRNYFRKKKFLLLVLVRALVLTCIITIWLTVINGIWESNIRNVSFSEGLWIYLGSEIYLVNLVTIFIIFVLMMGIYHISRLHRKGEIWNFIIGRYHHPRETERYFCFLDLNQSTTIAENLGHVRFGSFLKDFYSDLTDPIRFSGAEVYQYVGDEIVLTWPASPKTNLIKVIGSIFLMKEVFWAKSKYYNKKYGHIPSFKVGIHGGIVLVTWVGEVKKEIIYLGDVLNTAARIRSECPHLGCDLLVSRYIKDRTPPGPFSFSFSDKLELRGKSEKVEIFCVHEK